jgi:GNAT superfamily N-acetyltransferase
MVRTVDDLMQISMAGRLVLLNAVDTCYLEQRGDFWLLFQGQSRVVVSTTITNALDLQNFGIVHVFCDLETDLLHLNFWRLGWLESTRNFVIAYDLSVVMMPQNPLFECRLINSVADLEVINRLADKPLVLPQNFLSSGLRIYAAYQNLLPVAWVCAVTLSDSYSWNDSLFALPSIRGQGVGVELMAFVHAHEKELGLLESFSFCTDAIYPYHHRHGYQKVAYKILIHKSNWVMRLKQLARVALARAKLLFRI